jgi:hypothetical protein
MWIAFWDIIACIPLKVNRRFRNISPPSSGSKNEPNKNSARRKLLAEFCPEDGGDIFLHNIG